MRDVLFLQRRKKPNAILDRVQQHEENIHEAHRSYF